MKDWFESDTNQIQILPQGLSESDYTNALMELAAKMVYSFEQYTPSNVKGLVLDNLTREIAHLKGKESSYDGVNRYIHSLVRERSGQSFQEEVGKLKHQFLGTAFLHTQGKCRSAYGLYIAGNHLPSEKNVITSESLAEGGRYRREILEQGGRNIALKILKMIVNIMYRYEYFSSSTEKSNLDDVKFFSEMVIVCSRSKIKEGQKNIFINGYAVHVDINRHGILSVALKASSYRIPVESERYDLYDEGYELAFDSKLYSWERSDARQAKNMPSYFEAGKIVSESSILKAQERNIKRNAEILKESSAAPLKEIGYKEIKKNAIKKAKNQNLKAENTKSMRWLHAVEIAKDMLNRADIKYEPVMFSPSFCASRNMPSRIRSKNVKNENISNRSRYLQQQCIFKVITIYTLPNAFSAKELSIITEKIKSAFQEYDGVYIDDSFRINVIHDDGLFKKVISQVNQNNEGEGFIYISGGRQCLDDNLAKEIGLKNDWSNNKFDNKINSIARASNLSKAAVLESFDAYTQYKYAKRHDANLNNKSLYMPIQGLILTSEDIGLKSNVDLKDGDDEKSRGDGKDGIKHKIKSLPFELTLKKVLSDIVNEKIIDISPPSFTLHQKSERAGNDTESELSLSDGIYLAIGISTTQLRVEPFIQAAGFIVVVEMGKVRIEKCIKTRWSKLNRVSFAIQKRSIKENVCNGIIMPLAKHNKLLDADVACEIYQGLNNLSGGDFVLIDISRGQSLNICAQGLAPQIIPSYKYIPNRKKRIDRRFSLFQSLTNGEDHPDKKKVGRSFSCTAVPHLCIPAKRDLYYEDHSCHGYARVFVNNLVNEQSSNEKVFKNNRVLDVMLSDGVQSPVFKLYISFFTHGLIRGWTTTKMTVIEKLMSELFAR